MIDALRERIGPLSAVLRVLGTSALALVLLVAVGPQASAQQVCMDRSELSSLLGQRYAETRVARGLSDRGRMIEVFASGDGATWTMVVTTPQGHSCIVASGEGWAGVLQRAPDQAV